MQFGSAVILVAVAFCLNIGLEVSISRLVFLSICRGRVRHKSPPLTKPIHFLSPLRIQQKNTTLFLELHSLMGFLII